MKCERTRWLCVPITFVVRLTNAKNILIEFEQLEFWTFSCFCLFLFSPFGRQLSFIPSLSLSFSFLSGCLSHSLSLPFSIAFCSRSTFNYIRCTCDHITFEGWAWMKSKTILPNWKCLSNWNLSDVLPAFLHHFGLAIFLAFFRNNETNVFTTGKSIWMSKCLSFCLVPGIQLDLNLAKNLITQISNRRKEKQ